ncbi:MAG: antibiotic biosynthesis monooxygenase [Pseudomonadota bacterium]
MFIAMNRFKIVPGHEDAFEAVWRNRTTRLSEVDGFREFKLLRGATGDEHTLYASHTIWENRAAFEAWTRSEHFRAAHASAGDNRGMYLGHPQFEGFETVLEE